MLEFQFVPDKSEEISNATHRLQDLIPAFLDAILKYAPHHYAAMTVAPFGPIPSYVQDEGDDSAWWDSDDAGFLLEELEQILMEHSPPGYYFGTLEGDGACFGFWQNPIDDCDYIVRQVGDAWTWNDTEAATEHDCCVAIREDMEKLSFWPDIWLDHGERGDYSLLVITEKE